MPSRLFRVTLCLLALGLLVGCRVISEPPVAPTPGLGGSPPPAPVLRRFQFESSHMGTRFHLTLFATNETAGAEAAQAAFQRINRLEELFSDYRADSELSLLRAAPAGRSVPVSFDLFHVLWRARELSQISGGAFDATIGPYVRLWRFSRKRHTLPEATELAAARAVVGYRHLALNSAKQEVTLQVPGMRLDLGGIAKGFAADEALKILRWRGIDRALMAASGDIAIGNPPPGQGGWRVAVTGIDADTNSLVRHLSLANAGVSTSGDTEQFIEIEGVRYAHIVSPLTGLGLTNRIQATVIGRNATTTDALATAVCVLGPERGLRMIEREPQTEALIIVKQGSREWRKASSGFSKFLAED